MSQKYDFSQTHGELNPTLPTKGFTNEQIESGNMIIKSTSRDTASISPIILKSNHSTRLLFYPTWVNKSQTDKPLRGGFRWERKGKNDVWESYKGKSVNKLKKGEFYDLNLDGESMKKLFDNLPIIKSELEHLGVQFGTTTISIGAGNIESVLLQIGDVKNKELVIAKLRELEKGNIQILEDILLSAKLQNAINTIKVNLDNGTEQFWQSFFSDNHWIFENIFNCPVFYLHGQPYLGGKNSRNSGGVIADFLIQNLANRSFAVVEIKTPTTKLVGGIYRGITDNDNTCYSMSNELSGSIVQLENQIRVANDNFAKIIGNDYQKEQLNAFDPFGILLIGNKTSLNSEEVKSLTLFRKGLSKNIILTYDELLTKLEAFLQINNKK